MYTTLFFSKPGRGFSFDVEPGGHTQRPFKTCYDPSESVEAGGGLSSPRFRADVINPHLHRFTIREHTAESGGGPGTITWTAMFTRMRCNFPGPVLQAACLRGQR
jgi:hypothetical protein